MNRLRSWVLCVAVLTFFSMTVFAADKNGYSTSKDGRKTYAARVSGYTPGFVPPGPLTIFNNISRYPKARYFCCAGETISGPNAGVGGQFADAVPFTPSANAHITQIVVGVGFVQGTNGVAVSINSDNNGLPGNPIASFNLTGLPQFGGCCVLDIKNGSIAVTGGTQYWVVVATDDNTLNTWDAWNDNTTDMTFLPFAFQDNGVWSAVQGVLPAVGIFGAP